MTTHLHGHKVANSSYKDLSDYARPVAIWIAGKLKNTQIRPYQVTLFHFLLMLLAIWLLVKGGITNIITFSLLLLAKNTFDAVDGSLARMQNRPSRVGRFLDSNVDFIGNFLLFLAFVHFPLWLRLLGFLCFIFQGSFFNFYYVLFRHANSGDKTSKVKENATSEYSYDNPMILKMLFYMYKVFYQWQDEFVAFINSLLKNKNRKISPLFITLLTVNGLGFQYLAIIVFLLLGQERLLFGWFIIVMNLYLGVLLLIFS